MCKSPHTILLVFLLTISLVTPTVAGVNDNVLTSKLEQTIGSYDDATTDKTLFGLLQKIYQQVVRLSVVENKVDALSAQLTTSTAQLTQSIESVTQSATASYNLFVYIPKEEALFDYSGTKISITSPTGNQSVSATFRDSGSSYSTTLYFNFNETCTLKYNLLGASGESIEFSEPVTIDASSKEFLLGHNTAILPPLYVHWLCKANLTNRILPDGCKILNDWYVVEHTTNNGYDALKLFRCAFIGSNRLRTAKSIANSYYNQFNNNYSGMQAYSSRLVEFSEAGNGGSLSEYIKSMCVADYTRYNIWTGTFLQTVYKYDNFGNPIGSYDRYYYINMYRNPSYGTFTYEYDYGDDVDGVNFNILPVVFAQ